MIELKFSVLSTDSIIAISRGYEFIQGYGQFCYHIMVTYGTSKAMHTITLGYGLKSEDRDEDFVKLKKLVFTK